MIRKWIKYLLPIFCIYMLCLNAYLFQVSMDIQGDARVVNYAGLARGVTQRLVKLEIAGQHRDDLIEEMNRIMEGLSGKNNYLNIRFMKDDAFQSSLNTLADLWLQLKQSLLEYREGTYSLDDLMALSELHFTCADESVTYAENYSDKKVMAVQNAKQTATVLSAIFLFIVSIGLVQIFLLQKKNGYLNYLAYTDRKTGLPNRAKCDQVLDYYHLSSMPEQFVCISIDLDNLKKTNDKIGHAAGDELIQSFGMMIGLCAVKYGFVGRNGGDEFIALFDNCTKERAMKFIKELDNMIESNNLEEGNIKINFSYGMAQSFEEKVFDIRELLHIADMRMYKNKAARKENGNI